MISKSGTLLTTAAVLLLGMTGLGTTANATTPDGETPANEGVCNVLKVDGITKGLYGLCVAYCEAQDLDILADKDPPSTKILDNYNRKKQLTDPDMPCLQAPCPCWSTEQIFGNISTQVDGILGTAGVKTCTLVDDVAMIENRVETINGVAQRARVDSGRLLCRFLDQTGMSSPPSSFVFPITAEEAASCATEVTTACGSL